MTQTYNVSGSGSLFSNVVRGVFVAAATIGGLFLFAASAAFAFFVLAGIVMLGLLVFGFFWTRAKLLGRPFGPKAQFEAARKEMEAQMRSARSGGAGLEDDGPVIDAHQTPEGWSVDR